MPPSMPSATEPDYTIGKLASQPEEPAALPPFISQRADGLYISLAQLENATLFFEFIDRSFAADTFFHKLDYPRFIELLYGELAKLRTECPAPIRFADKMVQFAPERKALYRQIKIANGEAIYLFDPAYLETVVDEPVMGDLPDGSVGVLRVEQRTISQPASLDIDEFITCAWQQGIRYGIDCPAVVDAMLHSKADRIVVARPLAVIAGKDAEIKPESSNIKRSNAPKKLDDGRIDLTQYENRHPQVTNGLRLFKKIPLQLGTNGRDITGKPIAAPIPSDVDLTHCCGEGTKIINEPDGECLITTAVGFLNIDAGSGEVSITDKIISREGVSIRTTGDLSLEGEEYEEYGEIQEKRTVKCQSITAHADVFGNIISTGGLILLKHNLVGGNASNTHGDICIEGVSSGATLITNTGSIRVKRAENCLLIGHEVHVEEAVRCDILADKIVIENIESCALAGQQIEITHARSTHGVENVFSLLVPDLSEFKAKRSSLLTEETELNAAIQEQHDKMDNLRAHPEVNQYLQIATKVQRKELTLSPEQQQGLKKLAAKITPALKALRLLNENLHSLQDCIKDLHAELDELDTAIQATAVGVDCSVGLIDGDTRIRSLSVKADAPLTQLPAKDLRIRLRTTDGATKSLLSADSGKFNWHYTDDQS